MAQDSDDPFFVVNIVVWVLVVRCTVHGPRVLVEVYGDVPSDVIKVFSASWD